MSHETPIRERGLTVRSYVRHRALAENEYIISAFAECGGLLISASFPATHQSSNLTERRPITHPGLVEKKAKVFHSSMKGQHSVGKGFNRPMTLKDESDMVNKLSVG